MRLLHFHLFFNLRYYLVITILTLLSLIGLSTGILSATYLLSDQICEGVNIAGIEVGGWTKEEAEKGIQLRVKERIKRPLIIKVGDKRYSLDLKELNLRYDIQEVVAQAYRVGRGKEFFANLKRRRYIAKFKKRLPFEFSLNPQALENYLLTLSEVVNCKARDAHLSLKTQEIIKEEVGKRLDKESSLRRIKESLSSLDWEEVELEVIKIEPEIKFEDLRKINLKTPLSSYATKFNPAERNRSHNIKLAAEAIDEYILSPGKAFSYNQIVGPRQMKYGYKEAPVIIKGKLVPAEGGGACQVSSTLFNVALLAGLKVIERVPHTFPSAYVPLGRDATVDYGNIDLKFKNDIKKILVFSAKVRGSELKIEIFGERPRERDVKVTTIYKERIGHGIKEIEDTHLEEGKEIVEEKGRNGYKVKLLRVIRLGGKEVQRKTFYSLYKPMDKVVRVGRKPKPISPRSTVHGHSP
ncbi:MAG: hypothetical protein COS84_11645 [Armatimonadetes bacterium CG07_land_8_20_14_0_80_40_9]|nr:MAG: hypothetical protein COS84_11645 [Armatimonadetes bacterium CG07_land_8_20_14_0_80_40_9]